MIFFCSDITWDDGGFDDDSDLPKEVTFTDIPDMEEGEVEDYLSEMLSNMYGFCPKGFFHKKIEVQARQSYDTIWEGQEIGQRWGQDYLGRRKLPVPCTLNCCLNEDGLILDIVNKQGEVIATQSIDITTLTDMCK